MEWWLAGIIMFSGVLLLLILGTPVAFGLAIVPTVFMLFIWGPSGLLTMAANAFSSQTNYLLLAGPLFIFMGECIVASGLGSDAFRAVEVWLGRLPGGLAITTIGTATVFGAATGFSGTATVAFGPVALPEMAKRKYDQGIAMGALAGGSALAVLIPPSVPLIMYGFLSGASIAKLFYAGLIPGILGSLLFMLYVFTRVTVNPSLAPERYATTWHDKFSNTWRILPLFVLILMVLGSIWGGIATPTEAAALGALGSFILMIGYRRSSWSTLKDLLFRTVEITSMIYAIIIGAFTFTQALSYCGFVTNFSAWIVGLPVSPWFVLALMMLTNIFLGCFLDTMGILFLTLPIYLPIITHLGFDIIWFGILITINSEIGCLTPPVGINLYMLKGIAPPEVTFTDAVRGVAVYWFLYLALLILVILVPQLALWLPSIAG